MSDESKMSLMSIQASLGLCVEIYVGHWIPPQDVPAADVKSSIRTCQSNVVGSGSRVETASINSQPLL